MAALVSILVGIFDIIFFFVFYMMLSFEVRGYIIHIIVCATSLFLVFVLIWTGGVICVRWYFLLKIFADNKWILNTPSWIENMLERNECNRKSNEILVKNMCVRRCHVFRFALLFFLVIIHFIGLLEERMIFRVDLICSTNLYIVWGRLQFSFSNILFCTLCTFCASFFLRFFFNWNFLLECLVGLV